jgi:hypothetical protein
MASAQVDTLFGAASDFAKEMLAKHKGFHPFGVSMNADGAVAMVAGYTGSEHPPAQEIISVLENAFIAEAKTGAIQAAGICLDVRVVPPGQNNKTDAICVRLSSVSGEAVEVFVPYRKPFIGRHVFGAVFATKGGFKIHDV